MPNLFVLLLVLDSAMTEGPGIFPSRQAMSKRVPAMAVRKQKGNARRTHAFPKNRAAPLIG
jgi:hypothetical protein